MADGMRANDLESAAGVARPALMAEFAADYSSSQRRQRGEGLDRGARREGLFKSRPRIDHRSQTAVLRIDDNDRAFAIAERFFGDSLHGAVEFGFRKRGN